MFIPEAVVSLLVVNRDTMEALRLEAASLKAKNDVLERELVSIKVNSDWMRLRVNQLEAERAALIEKAYPDLTLPVPEIARLANRVRPGFDLQSLFEDQGEDEPLSS